MEHWDSLGFLVVTLNYNVTIVGKLWLVLVVLLRVAVVVLAGYPLYQDEQERFICNTLQPGCSNVCYDLFSPVSHLRFWLLQTLAVLLPQAAFGMYVVHQAAVHLVGMQCGLQGCRAKKGSSSPRDQLWKLCELCGSAVVSRSGGGAAKLSILNFSGAYTVQLVCRTLLEAAFAALQYFLFGFFVPERFSCYHPPCTSTVDCYISRPTEKSIMVVFIWGVSSLSFLLSLADLVCGLRRMRVRNQKNKLPVENECVAALPPVQHGSSSAPQNQGCPVSSSSQTSGGSCSLLSEEAGDVGLHPEVTSQQAAGMNLPSNPPCASDLAVNQDSTEEPLCVGDHQGTQCRQVRPRPQQDFFKDAALALRPQIKSHLGVSSSVVQSKLLGYYPSAELQNPDAQSNYSSTSCLRSKKSEWV